METSLPRPPVALEGLLPDPGLVRRLVEHNSPYWPIQRYFASAEEMRALSDVVEGSERAAAPLFVAPVFRGDWAYDRPLIPGVEPILHNERFIDAARRIFGGTVVRPQIVYVNLTLPMPAGDRGHTDVPAFRGIDRTAYPIWLLVTMGRSGLFERWRTPIATGVSWFYAGAGGEFTYWPDGPDHPPITRPAHTNTALVGDNDLMFHRVEAVGRPDDDMVRGLSLDSLLTFAGDGRWNVVEDGRVLASRRFEDIRISVSWKAQVFRGEGEARIVDQHLDDLRFEQVLETFLADLAERGVAVAPPADPLHDPAFVAILTKAYHRAPSVYPKPSPRANA